MESDLMTSKRVRLTVPVGSGGVETIPWSCGQLCWWHWCRSRSLGLGGRCRKSNPQQDMRFQQSIDKAFWVWDASNFAKKMEGFGHKTHSQKTWWTLLHTMDGQKVVFKGQWWLNFDYYAVISGEGRFGWGKGGRVVRISMKHDET